MGAIRHEQESLVFPERDPFPVAGHGCVPQLQLQGRFVDQFHAGAGQPKLQNTFHNVGLSLAGALAPACGDGIQLGHEVWRTRPMEVDHPEFPGRVHCGGIGQTVFHMGHRHHRPRRQIRTVDPRMGGPIDPGSVGLVYGGDAVRYANQGFVGLVPELGLGEQNSHLRHIHGKRREIRQDRAGQQIPLHVVGQGPRQASRPYRLRRQWLPVPQILPSDAGPWNRARGWGKAPGAGRFLPL